MHVIVAITFSGPLGLGVGAMECDGPPQVPSSSCRCTPPGTTTAASSKRREEQVAGSLLVCLPRLSVVLPFLGGEGRGSRPGRYVLVLLFVSQIRHGADPQARPGLSGDDPCPRHGRAEGAAAQGAAGFRVGGV